MKRWLIILSIICGIGFISSAVLAGRVYYQDLKNYTDYDKKELQTEALKNIYIKSSVPIEIYPTSGTPYVEFNQSFTDLIGSAPEYELDVQSKGENTYIELNETKEIFLWLGVKESKAQLSIYLPQTTINRLNIINNKYFNYKRNKQVVNLEGINVNELTANMNETEFVLDGNYEKINISVPQGQMNLKSNTQVQLITQGSLAQYLTGEFDKITINDNSRDIIIDSTSANSVEINSYHSNIDLKGNYSKVKLKGNSNTIDIRSESICKLYTNGDGNYINGNGAFEVMSLDESNSEIEIQTTVIPTKLDFGKNAFDSTLSLTLPSNIPGFAIKYLGDYDMEESEFNYYEEYESDNLNLVSDFALEEKSEKGERIFTYGDGSLQILVNANQRNSLEIIDGVYSSSTAQ